MPPHRRFSYPGLEVQELLQLGSFSTASEACCACGALERMGPGVVADYGLNDLSERGIIITLGLHDPIRLEGITTARPPKS